MRFGPFELDEPRRRLLRGDQTLPLGGKAFDVLAMLVRHHDRVLTRAELLERVWPDVVVEESNLTQTISVIRKTLGDGEYIATVPARGYRFVAPVIEGDRAQTAIAAPAAASLVTAPAADGRGLRARPMPLVAAALALLIAGWLLGRASNAPRATGVVPDSIAVLPFYDRDHLGQPDRFGLDLTERVIAELTRTTRLRVKPPADVLEFSDPRDDTPAAAGRQLRAERVVTGAISRRAAAIRLAVQVVRTSDGAILASEILEVPNDDDRALASRVIAVLRLTSGV